uniref:SB domain-containing protein n=1 Tax=Panagrellus redivivus TaxID=6233 RepID=A0A7E4VSB6_PANRE
MSGQRSTFYTTPTSTQSRTSVEKRMKRSVSGEPGAGDLKTTPSMTNTNSPGQYTRKSPIEVAGGIFENDRLQAEVKDLQERLTRAQLDIDSYKSALKVSADNKKDVLRRLDALEELFQTKPDADVRHLLNELQDIRTIVTQEKYDCDLYDVLRQNADTIIVIDREMKSVVDGYGDAYKRSKFVHSKLSKISAAICEKLDEVNLGSFNGDDSRSVSVESSIVSSPLAPTQDESDVSVKTGVEKEAAVAPAPSRPSDSNYSQASIRMDAVLERLNHLQRAIDNRTDSDQRASLHAISVALLNIASGQMTPEQAYADLSRINAPITLADLQAVAPRKKHKAPKVSNSFKALRRMFSIKKSNDESTAV